MTPYKRIFYAIPLIPNKLIYYLNNKQQKR